jgi:endoglycosylceramidase
MRKAAGIATLALAAVAIAGASPAGAEPTEPLGHVGRWITDSHGRAVVFHGAAIVPVSEASTPESLGVSDDDAQWFADHGFNLVRLGWFDRGWETAPNAFNSAYIDSYERTQRVLARHGIFSLIDMHQDMLSPRYAGRGFADWFPVDNGLPNQPSFGVPGNYFLMPALNRAYDNLWANVNAPDGVGLQDHLAEGWRRAAARFAPLDHVAGYDVFNEPWPGTAWPSCANPAGCPPGGFDQTQLTAFNNRLIAGIRRADRVHTAYYEPNLEFDVGAATGHGKASDPNVGMSFHDYCLGAAPGLPHAPDPANVCQQTGERLVFQNAENHSAATGATLVMTEFGDTMDVAVQKRIADLADEFMVGWNTWAYIGSGGGSLIVDPSKPPTDSNTLVDVVKVLTRAYPRVVAGTPQRFTFDGDRRRLDAAWSTTMPNGRAAGALESEVFVPPLQFPNGYRVEVSGGEIAGGLGTREFRVRACPGATRVRITVTAATSVTPPSCVHQSVVTVSGNTAGQHLSLTVPRGCVQRGRRFKLAVGARPLRVFRSRHPRARLSRVDFFVDGVRKAIRHRAPFSATIDTAGLRPGRHRARVRIYLRRRIGRRTIVITRTLSARFSVC